ncbi:hypothetical protein GA0115245_105028 [Streptomyces sp. di188]|nr:hypothetical protein GA0115245_105028 [Streptomyces sp. di188]
MNRGRAGTLLLAELATWARRLGLTVVWCPSRVPPVTDPAGAPPAREVPARPGAAGPERRVLLCLSGADASAALPPLPQDARVVVARAVLPERPAAAHADRLTLTPLGRAEFRALVGPDATTERRELLYTLTGGIPGWLGTLSPLGTGELRALARDGLFPGPVPAQARTLPRWSGTSRPSSGPRPCWGTRSTRPSWPPSPTGAPRRY